MTYEFHYTIALQIQRQNASAGMHHCAVSIHRYQYVSSAGACRDELCCLWWIIETVVVSVRQLQFDELSELSWDAI